MRVPCPRNIEHPVVVVVPDLICPELMVRANERRERISGFNFFEYHASAFCGVHFLGTTTSASDENSNRSRLYINYCLNMLPENIQRIPYTVFSALSLATRVQPYALPVEGWPWTEIEQHNDPLHNTFETSQLEESFYIHLCRLSYSLSKYGSSSSASKVL